MVELRCCNNWKPKLAEQRHLRAIRDGIIATVPIIIVASMFMVIAFLPNSLPEHWSFTEWIMAHQTKILLPYRVSMYIMTLYAVFGIGYSLAESYDLDGLSGGILAELGYLLTIIPASVARSFEALTPTAIVLLFFATITMFLEIDVHSIVATLVEPLISASDTLPSVLVIIFLTGFFWVFGIHGASIVGSLARPLWLVLLEENTTAFVAGEAVKHIAAEPFYQWFIWIGGSGATLGLALLLAFKSKSTYGSTLGKTSLVPAIFNINEPMIFGVPIVLNPTLMIPFIIIPVFNGIIAWLATVWGWVNPVVANAPWTLPGPIGAFLATGNDWRALVLNVFLIILSVALYYPFFRIYDNQLVTEETEGQLYSEGA